MLKYITLYDSYYESLTYHVWCRYEYVIEKSIHNQNVIVVVTHMGLVMYCKSYYQYISYHDSSIYNWMMMYYYVTDKIITLSLRHSCSDSHRMDRILRIILLQFSTDPRPINVFAKSYIIYIKYKSRRFGSNNQFIKKV